MAEREFSKTWLRGTSRGASNALKQVENADESMAGKCLFLGVVAAVLYAITIGLIRRRLEPGSEGRRRADRLLCCWQDVYSGKSCFLYNVLFCPLLLPFHALRIYLPHCLCVYLKRLFWRACRCCTSLYTDGEFKPDDTSLGAVGGDSANRESGKSSSSVVWVRAMDLASGDSNSRGPKLHGDADMYLFQGEIEAHDLQQGSLGDCWLLAAMATVSGHESAISSLFVTREVDPRGKYKVRLYDPQEKCWKVIVVDDYVPCERDPRAADGIRRDKNGRALPLFARPQGNEIWAIILEKAFAKLCGSYAEIEGGITEWGMICMTGGDAWRYEVNEGGVWKRSDLVASSDSSDKRACGFRSTSEAHSSEELFEVLRHYHRNGAVLCCGGVSAAGEAKGLVSKHAFSLLQVRDVRKTAYSDQYFRFVQVRNPWGQGEWSGAWSDGSPEWDEYPHVKEVLKHESKDDGVYWMQWEDFCKYWTYVGCADVTTDILSMRTPIYLESTRLGPLKSFFKGCAQYWCLCLGLRHFFLQHQATKEQLSESEVGRTCGVDLSGCYCRLCEHEMVHVEDGKIVREAHEQRFV